MNEKNNQSIEAKCEVYLQAGWEGSWAYPRPYFDIIIALKDMNGRILYGDKFHTSPEDIQERLIYLLAKLSENLANHCDESIHPPITVNTRDSVDDFVGLSDFQLNYFSSCLNSFLSNREKKHLIIENG